MRALKDGGVLSVTLWNKEEPPKSVLKLYTTMAAAARDLDADIAGRFFVAASYLSTATVLYKRNGFSADEIEKLRAHTRAMSFDEIYSPGLRYDEAKTAEVLDGYKNQIFFDARRAGRGAEGRAAARGARRRRRSQPTRFHRAGDDDGAIDLAPPR